MQVVLVYLQPFRRNSLLNCLPQPRIAKNLLKFPILGIQDRLRSSMLTPLRSLSLVFVMVSNMFVPICDEQTNRETDTKTTTIFIWEKATRLPERGQAHQSWPPKSQIKKMQYMHRKTYRTEIC